MAFVCPSCDHEPPVGAGAGVVCPGCGEKLVSIIAAEALIGTELDGRFLITAKLGEGGMGVVYRATQKSVGREIALKLLDKRFESDIAAVKRFFREAKVASSLSHPKTVQIFDFGQSADGRLYIAMELVNGRTLHDELAATGPLGPARVCEIGLQLCEAVEAAHAMTIVHRDLKLENVMLLDGEGDRVKVLDFGLARSLADPSMRATSTGVISGTPRYMAPEVLSGAEPTGAQDIYAIGVILGELAHGSQLWDAPTFTALFTEKLTSNDNALARVPLWLRSLVERIIDLEPLKRPTLVEIREDLLAIRAEFAAGTLHLRSRLTLELDPMKSTQPLPSFPDQLDLIPLDGISQPAPMPTPESVVPATQLPAVPIVRFTAKPASLPPPMEAPKRPTPQPRLLVPEATSTFLAPPKRSPLIIALAAVVTLALGALVVFAIL
jgi:serine/threonine-protein kinase